MFSDSALAVAAALRAGAELVRERGQGGAAGDRSSDRVIASMLLAERPDDAVLSEETGSRGDRLAARRVWIVDPLDGTREYAEPDRDDWAVHVALWVDGELTAGAVAVPARREVWSTAPVDGIRAVAAPVDQRPVRRIVVSRSRAPEWASDVAADIGAQLITLGSAGAKTAALLRGDADAYLHDGGQFEWDSAAPVAVAAHYGWFTARIDGALLRYNQPDPYLPDLLICPPRSSGLLLERIAARRAVAEVAS